MRYLLACVLAAAAAAALTPAEGAAGLARVQGSFAGGALAVVDADGCRESSISFAAVDETTHVQPGPPATGARLDLFVQAYDACADEVLFAGGGTFALSADAFTISIRSGTARLQTTVELSDFTAPRTRTLTFDLVWQAVASPWIEAASLFRIREAGTFVLALDTSELSDALLLGSVTDGTTEYMDGDVTGAQLGNARSGVLIAPGAIGSASSQLGVSAAGAPVASSYESRWAVAIWEAFDDTGCIRRLGILVAEEVAVDREEPVRSGIADFSRWNHCTNEPELWVSTDGSVALADGSFTLSPSLAGARFRADVEGTDHVAGLPVTLTVDVGWTGTGPITRSATSSRSTVYGTSQTGRDAYVARLADVDATVGAPGGDLIGGYPVGPADLVSAAFGHNRAHVRTRP